MVMNNEVKKYLADIYFDGNIPGNLVRYLYDRYGEEPLEGYISPHLFWSYIADDVNALHAPLPFISLQYPSRHFHGFLFC